jgi:anti-sigma B factor antagonist
MDDDSSPGATAAVQRRGTEIDVTLAGELDAASCPDVLVAVVPALAGATAVAIDGAAVTFCDSAGLAALITISNRVGPDVPVRIVDPSRVLARLLELTGSTELFA